MIRNENSKISFHFSKFTITTRISKKYQKSNVIQISDQPKNNNQG